MTYKCSTILDSSYRNQTGIPQYGREVNGENVPFRNIRTMNFEGYFHLKATRKG